MELISVVVPVYNVEKYVDAFVESVLAQTYSNWEMIMVNDGSKDQSGEICDKWAKKESRITVIHQKNQGVSSARNTGMEYVKGDYLIFADPDDTVNPEMFERGVQHMKDYEADLVCFDLRKVINEVYQEPFRMIFKSRLLNNLNDIYAAIENNEQFYRQITMRLFRSSKILKYRFPGTTYGEDTILMLQFLREKPKIYLDTYVGYNYTIRKDSKIGASNKYDIKRHTDHNQIGYELYITSNLCNEHYQKFAYSEYLNYVYNSISYMLKNGDKQKYCEYADSVKKHVEIILNDEKAAGKKCILLSIYKKSPKVYWTIMHIPLRIKTMIKEKRIED